MLRLLSYRSVTEKATSPYPPGSAQQNARHFLPARGGPDTRGKRLILSAGRVLKTLGMSLRGAFLRRSNLQAVEFSKGEIASLTAQ